MQAVVLGSGMMGKAIAMDLCSHTSYDDVIVADKSNQALQRMQKELSGFDISYKQVDVTDKKDVSHLLEKAMICISAIPYMFNVSLTIQAIDRGVHFIDLGGNNHIVQQQRSLASKAKDQQITVIPDMGLAPGLVSVLTRAIVETYDQIDEVKIRVGGLPVHPKPPLNYELVFSPNGLINEYMEDALVLDQGVIKKVPSMTEIETIDFPDPFGAMEAFLTSGGCSTLPYTYKNRITYLDYKTIRYPGHCDKMKTMLDLGLGSVEPVDFGSEELAPREMLIAMLTEHLPSSGKDVVLLRVISTGKRNDETRKTTYECIDYFDEDTNCTAMMRMTGFPVSITADLIARGIIDKPGVFCPEEIIPVDPFLQELPRRDIHIGKKEERGY
jgi:lysine 6-dehydrogenase